MNNLTPADQKKRADLFIHLSIALIVFFIALRIPFDSDFFWHLKAGSVTIEQRAPLLIDQFSFTRAGSPWVNHSWLAEVVFSLIQRWFGSPGIMILVAMVTTATMLLVYQSMRGSAILRAFLLILSVLISAVVWAPRPQIFTLLCFALLYRWVLRYDQNPQPKILVFIQVLFILWSNLHAGFSIGIAFVGLYGAGKFLDGIGESRLAAEKKKLTSLFAMLVLCVLVVCINPNGINTWRVQFDTVSTQSLMLIEEWQPPDFRLIQQQPYLWIWVLFAFLAVTTKTKLPYRQILPLLFFGVLGFLAKRNYAPFAIVVFPALSILLLQFFEQNIQSNEYFRKFAGRAAKLNSSPKPGIQKAINLTFIAFLGMAVMIKIVYLGHEVVLAAYENKLLPAAAMEYLHNNGIPDGNVLNSYTWGGYIHWREPEIKIFVDGRTDLFGDEIIGEWMTMVGAGEGYEALLEKHKIGWVFLEAGMALNEELLENGWKVHYQDEKSMILNR